MKFAKSTQDLRIRKGDVIRSPKDSCQWPKKYAVRWGTVTSQFDHTLNLFIIISERKKFKQYLKLANWLMSRITMSVLSELKEDTFCALCSVRSMSKYYFKIVPPVLVSQRISPKETSSALFIFVRKLFHKLDLIRYCVIQKESKQFVGNLSLEIIGTYCFSRRHYNVLF